MVKHSVHVIPFDRTRSPTEWKVFHFLSQRGANVIREWLDAEKVPKAQIGKFQNLIDLLERGGPEVVPGFIHPVAKDLYKAKVKGHKGFMQLRPRLCRGPIGEFEFTFLCGAIERDGRDVPESCNQTARDRRAIVITDPTRRKRERIDR